MAKDTQYQHKKGQVLLLVISLVCFGLLALLMVIAGGAGDQAYADSERLVLQNAKVQVASVSVVESFQRRRIVYGQVESAKHSNIGFELSGILQSLQVSEGDSVKSGQTLATLDLARLEAQQNELRAALNRAKAEARLAELSAARVTELVNAKLEPQQRLDEASANLDAAQALVSEVEAQSASVTVEIQKSALRAPFDGQVLSQLIDQGTVVNIGQPVLTLISDSELEARFGLPENIAFGLSLGEQRPIRLGDDTFIGTVKSVAKQRTLATRTIDAVLSIDRNELSSQQLMALVSGDLVSIQVMLTVPKKGAWIPIGALANGVRGLWTVLVYNNTSETLSPRLVAVEHIDSQRAFISGAITQGDQIVVNGTHRFIPGQTVKKVEQVSMFKVAALTNKGQ